MAERTHDHGVVSTNSDRLQLYLSAEAKILSGQEVRMDGRVLRMPELAEVRAEIGRLQALVARENPRRTFGATADFGGCW